MSKAKSPRPASEKPKVAQSLPVFPSGIAYDSTPAGARDKRALWKIPAGQYPEETIEVDLESAIATETNMRLTGILVSGKWPSAQELERCATKPPMSGPRLSDLLVRLTTLSTQQWRRAALEQRQAKRKHMSDLAGRKRKPRESKWSQAVHDEAKAAYDGWRAVALETKNKHGTLWGTKWKDFAPICIAKIKKKTGVDVTERQLRVSILPVKKHPRPE